MLDNHVDKFLQKTPFFRLLFGFTLGIVFHFFFGFNTSIFLIFILSGIILMSCDLLIKNHQLVYKLRWIFGFGIFLFLFGLGMLITNQKDKKQASPYLNKQALFLCEITEAPQEKLTSVMAKVKVTGIVENNQVSTSQQSAKFIVFFAKDSSSVRLQNGNILLVNTTFNKPQSAGNPYEFDYPTYLKNKGVLGTTFVLPENWKLIGTNNDFSMIKLANQCRNKLLSIYQKYDMSKDEFAVLSALTLGYTDELSPDILDSFSTSGAMHILSVSGLHVGIIYLVINFLFSFMNRNEKLKLMKNVFIILFLWLYAFISGLCPSVIRSSLMLSLVCIGAMSNRRSEIYNSIFISAFIMLMCNPYLLLDVGFQLSYLAVLSIIYFQPKFYELWTVKNKFLDALWSLFTVSLAAQLGTAALGMFYFHQFPNYFWLTNIIVVPLSSLVIYLAVSLLFLNWIPFLNTILADLLILLVKLMNGIVTFIHNLPYALVENVWLEKSQLLLLFLGLISLTIAVVYRKYAMFILTFCSIIFYLSINLHINYQTMHADKLVVAAMKKAYGISFVKQNKSYLISDNPEKEAKAMKFFRMRNRIENPILLNNSTKSYNDALVSFEGKKIFVLSQDLFKNKTIESPVSVDYLVLTSNVKISISRLVHFIIPKKVIVDLSYPKWKNEKLMQECQSMNIEYYSIAANGAYIEQF